MYNYIVHIMNVDSHVVQSMNVPTEKMLECVCFSPDLDVNVSVNWTRPVFWNLGVTHTNCPWSG